MERQSTGFLRNFVITAGAMFCAFQVVVFLGRILPSHGSPTFEQSTFGAICEGLWLSLPHTCAAILAGILATYLVISRRPGLWGLAVAFHATLYGAGRMRWLHTPSAWDHVVVLAVYCGPVLAAIISSFATAWWLKFSNTGAEATHG